MMYIRRLSTTLLLSELNKQGYFKLDDEELYEAALDIIESTLTAPKYKSTYETVLYYNCSIKNEFIYISLKISKTENLFNFPRKINSNSRTYF